MRLKIRRNITAAHVLSLIALAVSLGGTAYATKLITSANIKNGTIRNIDVRTGTLTTRAVKNGSLLAADFKAGQLPAGAQGIQGVPGPITGTLPAGVTIKGSFWNLISMSGAGQYLHFPIALPLALASDPNYHIIGEGGVVSDISCPGTIADPRASSGHVCIYIQDMLNGTMGNMGNPTSGLSIVNGGIGSRFGVGLLVNSTGAGVVGARGTWAATGN